MNWAAGDERIRLAYLAGIFDGEGCVRIFKNKPHAGGKSVSYGLSVSISNTDRRLVDFLVDWVGGGYVKTSNEKRVNQRCCYFWVTSSRVATRFLRSIRPYVILKAEQVDVALEFSARIKPGCTPLTGSELEIRESFRSKLSLMKGKINAKQR